MPMLLTGDFRQILPVERKASRSRIVNISINNMPIWKNFKQCRLTRNMRVARTNNDWCHFLLRVGEGAQETRFPMK